MAEQFKFDAEQQIFESLFIAILFLLRVFDRNLLRRSRHRKYFFLILFCWRCLTWGLNRGLIYIYIIYIINRIEKEKSQWSIDLSTRNKTSSTYLTAVCNSFAGSHMDTNCEMPFIVIFTKRCHVEF